MEQYTDTQLAAELTKRGWICRAVSAEQPCAYIRIADVTEAVAYYFGITVEQIKGKRRHPCFVNPRHVAFLLCHELTGKSYRQIGFVIGGRDHTTVGHGASKARYLAERQPELANDIETIRSFMTQGGDHPVKTGNQPVAVPKKRTAITAEEMAVIKQKLAMKFADDDLSSVVARYTSKPLRERMEDIGRVGA